MYYRWDGEDLLLRLRLQPRASKNEVCGQHGDSLKIRLTSPPVDGKANAQLVKFLAGEFGVPKSQIQLVSGESSREKTVRIAAPKRLPEYVSAA